MNESALHLPRGETATGTGAGNGKSESDRRTSSECQWYCKASWQTVVSKQVAFYCGVMKD